MIEDLVGHTLDQSDRVNQDDRADPLNQGKQGSQADHDSP